MQSSLLMAFDLRPAQVEARFRFCCLWGKWGAAGRRRRRRRGGRGSNILLTLICLPWLQYWLVLLLLLPGQARVFNLKLGICIIASVNDQHFWICPSIIGSTPAVGEIYLKWQWGFWSNFSVSFVRVDCVSWWLISSFDNNKLLQASPGKPGQAQHQQKEEQI